MKRFDSLLCAILMGLCFSGYSAFYCGMREAIGALSSFLAAVLLGFFIVWFLARIHKYYEDEMKMREAVLKLIIGALQGKENEN